MEKERVSLQANIQELGQLTDYVERYALPTRKTSEVRHDAPDKEVAYSATRSMRRDIETTYDPIQGYFSEFFDPSNADEILTKYSLEAVAPQQIATIPAIVLQKKEGDRPLNADDFLTVDESDSAQETLDRAVERYGRDSIPGLFSTMAETLHRVTAVPLHDSLRTVISHTERTFGAIYANAQEYRQQGLPDEEATRQAMHFHTEEFLSDCEQIETRIAGGEDSQTAQRGVFKSRYEKIPKNGLDSELILPLSPQDAEGLSKVYSAQRRAYSQEELRLVNQMLSQNGVLKDSLIIYHSFLTNFAKEYLSMHPERVGETHEHFESIFLIQSQDEHGLHVNPNLRFLSTFSGNILGGVIRKLKESGQEVDRETLHPQHIMEGIKLAKNLGVFKMYVPKLNKSANADLVGWSSNLQQVCPADKVVSQSASTIVPQIYEAMTQKANQIYE